MLDSLPTGVLIPIVIGGAVLFVLVILALVMLGRRPRRNQVLRDNLTIDISALPVAGPNADALALEVYGVPARLAVLVIAPAGRGSILPGGQLMRQVVDSILPGMARVLDEHQPIFRKWPPQLSSQGFVQSFFTNMMLPGEEGRGTPWIAVAGKFSAAGNPLLAGLILCAADNNQLDHIVVEHDNRWHETIRLRS